MKYLYLILLTALVSCSKPKVEKNGLEIWAQAKVVEVKWWAINLNTATPITSTGTFTAEWDVYNDQNVFLYKRSGTANYTFTDGIATSFEKTTEQGALSMTAKNIKITSITGSGGYTWKY